MNHDDGNSIGDIGKSDIILLGVSRTSKTPTSIYLANRGLRTSNIPLVNENSIPGASGTYTENTKFGDKFERKKVKPIEIGEGCITYEGRFGQTLHFDGHDNTPKIKISTHVDDSGGDFRKEEIDVDDSSIYVLSRGMRDNFDGQSVSGKKVLIQSDGIFIKGRTKNIMHGIC